MGLFDWTKKKGESVAQEGKKYIAADEIKKNASYISQMAKILFNPKETTKNAKQETFLDAQKRLNVSQTDLIKVYKNNVYSFYISIVFSFICLFLVFFNLLNFSILGLISSFSILLLCLVQCFKFSFRAFQIRHQKLCPVSDWTKRPGEWFPTIG
jgi:hypothetical protein